jgi:uncharacterized protein
MQPAYFDTSVLLKTYVRENGSATAIRLIRLRQVFTSSITRLELVSALRRNLTAGLIDRKAYSAILKRIQQHIQKWRFVEVTPLGLEYAEKYVSDFDVRALDAVHISSAVIISQRFPRQLSFITSDSRQREVATHLGLDVLWVE